MEQRLQRRAVGEAAQRQQRRAAQQARPELGIADRRRPRNVKGCWNLGYCGLGCPTNAKQSMLVTTIPAALAKGATLLSRTRAGTLETGGANRVTALTCQAHAAGRRPARSARDPHSRAPFRDRLGGAIGSPALLLRSGLPDPYGRVGKRTFLHPTLISAAMMPYEVRGYAGAPQSVYSDHFLTVDPIDGPVGYKLEVPPLHPHA